MFSVSPEDDEIINLSDPFSPDHSSTPTVSLSYESVDDEYYDELDSYIGNPTLTELAFCETSKGGLMMLEGDFLILNTVLPEMLHNGIVFREVTAKQGCTLREMK